MRNKGTDVWVVAGSFLILILFVLCQPLLARYTDPQQRFYLEPPEGWKVQTSEDESGTAIFTAPDGVTSLIILPTAVPESAALETLPAAYEQLLRDARPGISVEVLKENSVRIANQSALQRQYSIEGDAGKRARALVTFIKVGRLSLTLSATISETEFAEMEPVLQASLRTLRFLEVDRAVAPTPSLAVQPAYEIQAKLKALEQAYRAGILSDQEYERKKDELVRQRERAHTPPMEPLQLRYNVQPGDEFRTRMNMEGKMVTELSQMVPVAKAEKLVKYQFIAVQKIESVTEDGTFVAKIDPIPVTISIDGELQEVDLESLPGVLVKLTELGQVVEFKYVTASTETPLSREALGFTGIFNAFARFPEEEIEIGDSWELSSVAPDTGFEGVAELLGSEQVQGRPCARIRIRSSMPISTPEQLERDFESQGLSVQGKTETDMIQCLDLETGWPLSGTGKTIYEATLFRNEEKLSHTTYNFDMNLTATHR